MATPEHLNHAPITEAVIDLRIETPTGITFEAFERLLEGHNNLGYVKKSRIMTGAFGFALKADESVQPLAERSRRIGVRLHSPDEKYVGQLSLEGFTLSRLQPYESWDNLIAEARRLWAGYSACLGGPRIIRAATRYINNLRLPITRPLEQFLNLVPLIPNDLSNVMLSGFLIRHVLNDPQSQATVILTEALEVKSLDAPLPIILDIDAFKEAPFSAPGSAVWAYLDQLRALKNRAFFACLTDPGVALYR